MNINATAEEEGMRKDYKGNKIWDEIMQIAAREISPVSFKTWIRPLVLSEIKGNRLIVKTNDAFTKNIVEERYMYLIKKSTTQVIEEPFELEFIVDQKVSTTTGLYQEARYTKKDNLIKDYSFETFVLGEGNEHVFYFRV